MELKIKKLHEDAKVPQFAHATDAGMDIYTVEDATIAPDERQFLKTGIALAVPHGYAALVWDKSGVAAKRGLKTLAGVIDADYRGEVMIGLHNLTNEAQSFAAGDKIAQILIQKVEQPTISVVDELDDTERGEGGFGSTGAQ